MRSSTKKYVYLRKYLQRITTGLLITLISNSSAFSQNCTTVNQIGINTGYDYTTNTAISAGSSDPKWQVTWLTAAASTFAGTPSLPYSAAVASNWSYVPANSGWISFLSNTNGITYASGADSLWGVRLEREFRICQADSFRISFDARWDNYVNSIELDPGLPSYQSIFTETPNQSTNNWGSTGNSNNPFSLTVWLTPGVHKLSFRVFDYPQSGGNPMGLNVVGTITSAGGTNSIVANDAPADCACGSGGCEDICYWKVQGNSILNGNNIFGTLSNHDVRIKTNSNDRGIFTNRGLLGWHTMTPTSYLHVLCTGNKPDDGSQGSDIRFERLERGKGNILVIDEKGYVYDSGVPISGAPKAKMSSNENDRIQVLEEEIRDLREKLEILNKNPAYKADAVGSGQNLLLQNVPNPFGKETTIEYFISGMQQSASIVVMDMSGKQLMAFKANRGKGSVTISGEQLLPGMYLYALIIDGQEIETKKMVLTK